MKFLLLFISAVLLSNYIHAADIEHPFSSTSFTTTTCNGSYLLQFGDNTELLINGESVFSADDEIWIAAYSTHDDNNGKLAGVKQITFGETTVLPVWEFSSSALDDESKYGIKNGEEVNYIVRLNGINYLAEVEYSTADSNTFSCDTMKIITKVTATNSPFGETKLPTDCSMSILIPESTSIEFDFDSSIPEPQEITFDSSNVITIPSESLWLGAFNQADELVGSTQILPGIPFNYIAVWGTDSTFNESGLQEGETIQWKLAKNGVISVETEVTFSDAANSAYSCNRMNQIDSISSSTVPWDPVTATDCNMTLLLPNDLEISLFGNEVLTGTKLWLVVSPELIDSPEFISGEKLIEVGTKTAIAIWGAETGDENGLQAGDTLNFYVYYLDESTNTWSLTPVSTVPSQISYQCNSYDALESIVATNTIIQDVPIKNNWNIWSTYLNTELENVWEVVDVIVDNVLIVKDQNGNVYWPEYGLKGIGNITPGQGYQMKLKDLTDEQTTFEINGVDHINDVVISLTEGWNIIGCLTKRTDVNIEEVFESITSQLSIIKNESGDVYWPIYSLNNIGNIKPGKGYQIKVTSDIAFSFPQDSL